MKRLLLLFIVFILNNSYSQDSWNRIYQPSGWQIKSFYKIHNSDNFISFLKKGENDYSSKRSFSLEYSNFEIKTKEDLFSKNGWYDFVYEVSILDNGKEIQVLNMELEKE